MCCVQHSCLLLCADVWGRGTAPRGPNRGTERRSAEQVGALHSERLCEPLSWPISGQDSDMLRGGLRQTVTVVTGFALRLDGSSSHASARTS
jgi:hypothetical protein